MRLILWLFLLSLLAIPACSGSHEPVNKGKDVPVHPKKEKTK
jgi:hypothetical protein